MVSSTTHLVFISSNCQLYIASVLWEELLNWRMSLIIMACEHICGGLSWLLNWCQRTQPIASRIISRHVALWESCLSKNWPVIHLAISIHCDSCCISLAVKSVLWLDVLMCQTTNTPTFRSLPWAPDMTSLNDQLGYGIINWKNDTFPLCWFWSQLYYHKNGMCILQALRIHRRDIAKMNT